MIGLMVQLKYPEKESLKKHLKTWEEKNEHKNEDIS